MSLGREFPADFLFWEWAIDHELLQVGETLNASFEAVGGYCVERRVYWRYDVPEELTAELKPKAELRETCTVTINLLQLLGMVATA